MTLQRDMDLIRALLKALSESASKSSRRSSLNLPPVLWAFNRARGVAHEFGQPHVLGGWKFLPDEVLGLGARGSLELHGSGNAEALAVEREESEPTHRALVAGGRGERAEVPEGTGVEHAIRDDGHFVAEHEHQMADRRGSREAEDGIHSGFSVSLVEECDFRASDRRTSRGLRPGIVSCRPQVVAEESQAFAFVLADRFAGDAFGEADLRERLAGQAAADDALAAGVFNTGDGIVQPASDVFLLFDLRENLVRGTPAIGEEPVASFGEGVHLAGLGVLLAIFGLDDVGAVNEPAALHQATQPPGERARDVGAEPGDRRVKRLQAVQQLQHRVLEQVRKRHVVAGIFFGYHHEPRQLRLDELVASPNVAGPHPQDKLRFFLGGEWGFPFRQQEVGHGLVLQLPSYGSSTSIFSPVSN